MPAKNIECQLAQGQIGRYLAGASMSTEAISQLEQHIAECDECTQFIDAKRRTLQEVSRTRQAAVSMPEPEPESQPEEAAPLAAPRNPAAQALIQAIREKTNPLSKEVVLESVREPMPPRKSHWRALGYSAALGAVLLAMSHLTANPTAIFGERVGAAAEKSAGEGSEVKSDKAPAHDVRDPFVPNAAPTGAAASSPSTAEPAVDSVEAPTTPTVETEAPAIGARSAVANPTVSPSTPTPPQTTVRARRPQRPVRQRADSAPRAGRTGNSIRVYDANGKPIP